ncbi:MAG: transporter, family, tetracycline resistance protein [Acidobacteriota bacterium]|jgi:DHA1 family tetracycline resistance protein-like MFS transporter|nr:transporter, family, tetracycline resistance protein [Acidobacteriota bacterium]
MKRSPLLVIFITVFIDLVGFGIVIPVLPFYVEGTRFGASPRVVGLLFASYSIMQLIFTPILGRMSDKYGRRPILFFSLLGTSLGFFILGFATTLWMLFAGRIIDGITGGNISTAQAYIADVTTEENRAKGMGLIGAAFGMGFIFGPAIGGILSRWGTHVPFLFAGALALANATLLYFVLPETVTPDHPARQSAATGRWSQLVSALRGSRLAFVLGIYFLFITAFSIMTSSFGLFTLYRFGFDAHDTGWVFAFVGVIGAVVQGGLIGRLVKMFGELPLVIAGALFFAASLFIIPMTGPSTGTVALLALGAFFALGNGLATPSLTSLASKSASAGEQGGVLGVTQSVASLARVVGPLISAALIYSAIATMGYDQKPHNMSDHSIAITFRAAAAIMFVAFILAIYFARTHAAEYRGGDTEAHVSFN